MSTTVKPPGHDIFCTPENSDFVSKVPYQTLSKSDQEIRLLKVLPNSGSGFVECELLPAMPLANIHKQYLALSYCAGSAKNTKPIKVNGVTSNVFANLHHALRTARHYWETHADQQHLLLWVDQICINQFDLAERSHQVGFMRHIYEKAKRTLICLSTSEAQGRETKWLIALEKLLAQGKGGEAMNNGMSPRNSGETTKSYRWVPGGPLGWPIRPWSQSRASSARMISVEEFLRGITDFCNLLYSPWWARAWVFQEFMVSAEAIFLYGNHAIHHEIFNELAMETYSVIVDLIVDDVVAGILNQLGLPFHFPMQLLYSTQTVMGFLHAKQDRTSSDIKRLLIYTQGGQASDKRDKIYSLLGLANAGYGIVPDYSAENDFEKLLVETTRRIILFEDSLDVLSYRSRFASRDCSPNFNSDGLLPSWVIDWTLCPENRESRGNKGRSMHFIDHNIMPESADASFEDAPHPRCPGALIPTLQVWAVPLDVDFHEISETVGGFNTLSLRYKGSFNYKIVSRLPVQSEEELWLLCGVGEPFLLIGRLSIWDKCVRKKRAFKSHMRGMAAYDVVVLNAIPAMGRNTFDVTSQHLSRRWPGRTRGNARFSPDS
ncbi:hypothetical protein NW752_007351 [Fusarium irregulare]|uniref:Heterokaryon incompatibility domain-containing protein n=1 Tax=Fusarium irregulare TaxID=2494466 RepID=A0A9W8PLH1_9HYPO|nr:hypothetical protein NW766_007749 [Fusarium irregulare]KAJ4014582.1 hypothetical protein NW752_007351 [Fusarium irregulare]